MEKTIIAALLMLISLISYAQGLMWTAKAELNMSSMSNVEESKMHPGSMQEWELGMLLMKLGLSVLLYCSL